MHPWQECGCLLICPPCPFPTLTLSVMGAAHRRGDEGSGAAGSDQDSASSEVTGRTEGQARSAADGVRGTGSSGLGAVSIVSLPWCCSVPAGVLGYWHLGKVELTQCSVVCSS